MNQAEKTPDPTIRVLVDEKFVKAGHKPENTSCDHAQYSFKEHGRYCPCGTCMVDFGD